MLQPQDIVVLMRLAGPSTPWSYQQLSDELGITPLEIEEGILRAEQSQLYSRRRQRVNAHALLEFATHGIKYAFPAVKQPRTLGMPTAYSAPPLNEHIIAAADDCLIWPDPNGTSFGEAIMPLHHSVPKAARENPTLYRRLALVDALRVGRARERALATKALDLELDD